MVISMTRDEYKRRYGVSPVIPVTDQEIAPVPRSMTRAEYNAEFGFKDTQKEGTFTKIGNAINEVNPLYQIPKAAIEGAAKVGTGLGDILNAKGPSEVIRPTASALAGGTQMALAVPFGLFESATNIPGVKQIKNFLMNPEAGIPKWAGDKISDWKPLQNFVAQHPDSPEVVNDIITVALGLAGGKEAKSPEFKDNMVYVKSKVIEPTLNKLEAKFDNTNATVTTKIANDLVNIKNGVNRKTLTPEIQSRDIASATRLAETDALSGMVNSSGTIDPLLINDAIARYRYLREGDIDRSLVKNRLVEETKATNGATATNVGELTAALTEAADRFTGSFRDKLDGAISSEIRGLLKRADETGKIKLEDIHQAKIDNSLAASKDYGKLSSDAIEWRKAKANAYKKIVERNSKVNVVVDGKTYTIKDINSELGKTEQDIAFLRSLAGRKVEGGRLGKHFASISGNLIGYAAGSMFGPIGGAIGSAVGGEMARGIKGKQMKRTFGKDRKLPVEKNSILQEANKPQATDILRIPDKAVRAVEGIKKTPEISKVEAQIKRNVESQKKAIKAGDFTLVAQLKEIYTNLVKHLKDLIKEYKKMSPGEKQKGAIKNPFAVKDSKSTPESVVKKTDVGDIQIIKDYLVNPSIENVTKVQPIIDGMKIDKMESKMQTRFLKEVVDNADLKNQSSKSLGSLKKQYKANKIATKTGISKDTTKSNTGQSPLLQEAKKYKSAEEFVKAQQPEKIKFTSAKAGKDYMGGHEAPMAEDINAPIWDLTGKYTGNNLYPKDIYSPDASRLYSSGMDYDNQAISILKSIKDKPNAKVTVYRSVPKDVKGEINPGDWVTLTKEYAIDHGESNLGGKYKIVKKEVYARDIFTDANSIQEFGYDPQPRLAPKDTPYDLLSKAYKEGKIDLHSQYQSQLTDIWNKANKK